jgi:hypothetical protein
MNKIKNLFIISIIFLNINGTRIIVYYNKCIYNISKDKLKEIESQTFKLYNISEQGINSKEEYKNLELDILKLKAVEKNLNKYIYLDGKQSPNMELLSSATHKYIEDQLNKHISKIILQI